MPALHAQAPPAVDAAFRPTTSKIPVTLRRGGDGLERDAVTEALEDADAAPDGAFGMAAIEVVGPARLPFVA